MSANLSVFINISRWFAAFLVVISHLRNLILVDFKDVESNTVLTKALYFITGLGHEAVVIFFVISGFLVGGVTMRRWGKSGPDLYLYSSQRISRIYTVLIPALLVGLFLDVVGLNWFNASGLYSDPAQYHTASLKSAISATIDLPTFLGNLFMMQGILTGNLGSNGPLWSLAYEWWYYCVFALFGAGLTSIGKKRVGYMVLAFLLIVILPAKLVLWGAIWVLGIVAYFWVVSSKWRPHPLLGVGLFLFAMVCSRIAPNSEGASSNGQLIFEFSKDFVLAFFYVLALVSMSRMSVRLPMARVHEFLAEFSYTTYLLHFPFMLFIAAVGYQALGLNFKAQPSIYGVLYFIASIVLIYAYCYIFSLFTERYTSIVRKKLDSYVGLRSCDAGVQKKV